MEEGMVPLVGDYYFFWTNVKNDAKSGQLSREMVAMEEGGELKEGISHGLCQGAGLLRPGWQITSQIIPISAGTHQARDNSMMKLLFFAPCVHNVRRIQFWLTCTNCLVL